MSLKISIVTPSYNQGEFIEKTIQSVLNQEYDNLEYFIIDGGSTDSTIDVIKKYEDKITGWVSEADNGQSHAINKGFGLCTGDIYTWLNSDDFLQPNVLESVNEEFRKYNRPAAIYGKTRLINNRGLIRLEGEEPKNLMARTLAGIPFPQPASFFNGLFVRENNLRVDEDLHYGMDYDFFLRLKQYGDYCYTGTEYSNYLIHEDSKSSKDNLKFAFEWNLIYQSMLKSIGCFESFKERISDFELEIDKTVPYNLNLVVDKKDVDDSFFYYLKWQVLFKFNGEQSKGLMNILRYLFSNYQKAQNDKQLLEIHRRIRFFPKSYFVMKRIKSKLK